MVGNIFSWNIWMSRRIYHKARKLRFPGEVKTMDVEVINLTPHSVRLITEKETLEFPSQGNLRVSTETERENLPDFPFPLSRTKFKCLESMPERKAGRFYIVSSLVCQFAPERDDFLIVNETIRNEKGEIIGCRSFSVNPFFKKD